MCILMRFYLRPFQQVFHNIYKKVSCSFYAETLLIFNTEFNVKIDIKLISLLRMSVIC